MNNQQKLNIVMFNMSKYSDWQKGVANRNFHVLHNLAKSSRVNKIIAVDFLPFNFKRAIKTYIKDQIIKDMRGNIVYGNLTSRCWQVTSKILVFSSIDSVLNPKNILTELNKIIIKEDMQNNLITWNYNPLYTDYLGNQLNQTLNVFDAVDDWLTHSSYEKFKSTLKKNYQTIKEQSNLIFTVSKSLKEELFDNNNNVHWLPNAVDLELFQNEIKISQRLNNISSPIIGFLGILQDRIDLEILHYLAQNNPKKSIVLAGPVWKDFPKKLFEQYKNVHFLGPIPFNEIPSLYNGFDVGIITYKVNDFIKSTDPMKFYEYLAAKLPIVSTPVAGLDRFADYVNIAKTPQQFNEFVNQAILEGKLNSSYEILKNQTWQLRVNEMLNLIYSKL